MLILKLEKRGSTTYMFRKIELLMSIITSRMSPRYHVSGELLRNHLMGLGRKFQCSSRAGKHITA